MSVSFRRLRRATAFAYAFAFLVLSLLAGAALPAAAAGTSQVSGTVALDGKPVAGAKVTFSGNDVSVVVTSDAHGRFAVSSLPLGTYTVTAVGPGGERTKVNLDVTAGGAAIALVLGGLKEIGGSGATVRPAPVRAAGTDLSLNSNYLQHTPNNGSFSETLIQLPGAVRGANGVVHLNGDHGVINYFVDGVPIPQALNRQIGSEIDPNDISFVDVVEGAWPAQYGLRFGSSLNIATRAGTGPAGAELDVKAGSYTDLDTSLAYHAPISGGGGFDVALRAQDGTRGLDPPDFDSPHNDFSNTSQFFRIALPRGHNDFTDLTISHSFRSYQIPNDTQFGEPASTDDSEKQDDTFVNLQFRQALGTTGEWSIGPALKISHVLDFGDPQNDFAYGEALNILPPPFGNGGTSTDCATAYIPGTSNPNYAPTTCAFSLDDNKTSTDYRLQSDFVQHYGSHEVRAGVAYDLTNVSKRYSITLQPNNFLAPIQTPATPDAPTTVTDDNPNVGNTYESYVQDSWRLGHTDEIDYGLRYDYFNIGSTDFKQGFGGFSPRLKFTHFFGASASVYAYVGRLFEPFSFENVDPHAAQLLNLPLQPTVAQFDLKPERDTFLELGGHLPLAGGSLGLRVWQKNANDLIDDTQVGVTLLHQDINYVLGRISQEAAYYEHALPRNGRAYLSIAHTVSLNSGCETQLLAPCYGAPTGFTPADHDQSYSVTGGTLLNDRRGGWFSVNGEYGSGLSSSICPPTTPGNCKRTPHTIFSAEKGVPLAHNVAATAEVDNLLNDRYYVTILNAQGNHYAPPRLFSLGLRVTTH
jgi:hypothetical protein